MSTALSICHGKFGRASLYQLDRPLTRHAHREGHLIFHVKGHAACCNVSGEYLELSPCQGVAVNPWQMHDFDPGASSDAKLFLVLYINESWFNDFGRASNAPLRFGNPQVEIDSVGSRLVSNVVSLLLSGNRTTAIDGYLYELTEHSYEQSQRGQSALPDRRPWSTPVNDGRVRKSMMVMSETIGADIDMDSVARASGLSRPHFFKLFRKQTGLTPNLFMNTLRMEKAIESLTRTELSVSDIGFDLGFSSQSSFTRFFSSNVGMPPTSYRRVAHVVHS